MNIANYGKNYKWISDMRKLPKQFKLCDHSWRSLEDGEHNNGTLTTHECVLCGLEKDETWNPIIYCYQLTDW